MQKGQFVIFGTGGDWYSAYIIAVTHGYTGRLDGFQALYDNNLYSPNYNGGISFTNSYFTSSSGIDKDGAFYVIAHKVTETITINPAGQGGGGIASTVFGGIGIAGDITSMSNSTFRLTNGAYNGSQFSPKLYSGWKGASIARITTYSLSKVGTALSFGASLVTTGNAYYDITTGKQQPITYLDAAVGTVGVLSTVASYYNPAASIPYVGEAVAIYGASRLTWDIFYNLGANWGPIGAYYGTNKWSGK